MMPTVVICDGKKEKSVKLDGDYGFLYTQEFVNQEKNKIYEDCVWLISEVERLTSEVERLKAELKDKDKESDSAKKQEVYWFIGIRMDGHFSDLLKLGGGKGEWLGLDGQPTASSLSLVYARKAKDKYIEITAKDAAYIMDNAEKAKELGMELRKPYFGCEYMDFSIGVVGHWTCDRPWKPVGVAGYRYCRKSEPKVKDTAYCHKCGKEVAPKGSKYCRHCGVELKDA